MKNIDTIATTRCLGAIRKEIEQTLKEIFDSFIGREITDKVIQEIEITLSTQVEARYGHLYNQQQYTVGINVTPSEHSPSNVLLSWGLCERSTAEEESQGL